MTRTYKVIVNPTSGRGRGARSIPKIEEFLRVEGLAFDLVRTERPWHATELARQAAREGYDVVVAAGGDGTVNEVLNGLMRARYEDGCDGVAMGVLCVGTGNDFAFGVGVPSDLEAACRVLCEGALRQIDVGRVAGGRYPEGRYFGNGVGIGFDALVGFEAVRFKWLGGVLSYAVGALKTIFFRRQRAPLIQVTCDDETWTRSSLMLSVMNGQRMGGGFMMAPHSEIDDGLLDLCLAGQVCRLCMLPLILRFIRGTQVAHRAISASRAHRVMISAVEGALPAHADGETLCEAGQRLSIELFQHQLDVVCPTPSRAG
jgi:YegS/Rv2252/BmrU family lipid kinase